VLVDPLHLFHDWREIAALRSGYLGDRVDYVPHGQFPAEVAQSLQVTHRLNIGQSEIHHRLAAAQRIAREQGVDPQKDGKTPIPQGPERLHATLDARSRRIEKLPMFVVVERQRTL